MDEIHRDELVQLAPSVRERVSMSNGDETPLRGLRACWRARIILPPKTCWSSPKASRAGFR
jgi:hypothetical protein